MRKIKNKVSIILADDDRDDQVIFYDAISDVLESFDYLTFSNGLELVSFLKDDANDVPTLLFLDINMPLMGGFEALRVIREDLKLSSLTVAMYSTSADASHIARSFIGGANIYVTKPNEYDRLKQTVHRIISAYIESGDGTNFVLSM